MACLFYLASMRLLPLFSCLAFPILAFCQEDKINPDRPDQTEGTHVIAPGEVQLEADFYYNYFQEEKDALISSNLLRVGIVPRAELRLIVEEGRQRDVFIDETTQGVYPLSLGTKIALIKEHDWIPNISVSPSVQLPFTSRTSENKMLWSPSVILATEYEIEKFSIDFNVGWKQSAFDTHNAAIASASFRYEWTEKLESFVEYFGAYSASSHPRHNADMGLMYLLSKQLLISASWGTSLLQEEYNGFALAGFAFRLPK